MESRIPIPLILAETEPGPASDAQTSADHFMALQKRRILAGVNLLYLREHDGLPQTMALIRKAVGRNAFVSGEILQTTGLSFDESVSDYEKKAVFFKNAGVDLVFFHDFTSMPALRAAAFSAHKADIPAIFSVLIAEDNRTRENLDPLAALMVLQSLGAFSFGVSCAADDLTQNVERLTPYADIPVYAEPILENNLDENSFENFCTDLSKTGAKIVNWPNLSGDSLKILSLKLSQYRSFYPEKEEALAVSGLYDAYFLDENRIEFSEPITCGFSLEDDLIDIEDEAGTVTLVKLDTETDVDLFLESSHVLRFPVAFYTNSETLLRRALYEYHGKAIIDSNCEIEEDVLKTLAAEYGTLLY